MLCIIELINIPIKSTILIIYILNEIYFDIYVVLRICNMTACLLKNCSVMHICYVLTAALTFLMYIHGRNAIQCFYDLREEMET